MSDFPGPFDPPELTVPYPPPEVGEASPWAPADGENRDRILDWWRAWWRRVFFPWLANFIGYLNTWLEDAEAYIIAHAISGYSFRTTTTPLDPNIGNTTDAVFIVDQAFRPLVVGDLVLDETTSSIYGEITALVDPTHATVTTLGTLKGVAGHGWWVTATPISATGTTDVVITPETDRVPQINDLVSDESSALRYGIVTALVDSTHVTVSPLGVLRGLPGFGWWSTATAITHSGTTDVVLATGPDRLPQINDLVVDDTTSAAYGEIIAVADATHVTVAYIGTLQGDPGVVQSIVAGDHVTVDSTDPANPIVSATGTGGEVDSVVAGTAVTVDATDPANPIVGVNQMALLPIETVALPDPAAWTGQIVYAQGITALDDGPYYSDGTTWTLLGSGGGGAVASVVAGTAITVDSTDPANPIVNLDQTHTLPSFANEAAFPPAADYAGQLVYNADDTWVWGSDGTSWFTYQPSGGGGTVNSVTAAEAPYNVDTPVGFTGTSVDPVLEFNLITTDSGSGETSEFGGPATNLRMKYDDSVWTSRVRVGNASTGVELTSFLDVDGSGAQLSVTPASTSGGVGNVAVSGALFNLPVLSADPPGTWTEGAIYYSSTTHAIRVYDGSAWS